MKKLIKFTYKHFLLAFGIQFLFGLIINFDMPIFQQALIVFTFWTMINFGFEIYQKNTGGKNTFLNMIEDSIATGLGGIVGLLISNLWI